jgi:hypothetical protein
LPPPDALTVEASLREPEPDSLCACFEVRSAHDCSGHGWREATRANVDARHTVALGRVGDASPLPGERLALLRP